MDSRVASRHTKGANSLRDKKLLYAVKQFNLEPSRGITLLDESGFVNRSDPKALAGFLFREGRLSKKQIGAFLGGLVSFLAPCVLPIIPGFLAYLAGSSTNETGPRRKEIFINSIFFVLGFGIVLPFLACF